MFHLPKVTSIHPDLILLLFLVVDCRLLVEFILLYTRSDCEQTWGYVTFISTSVSPWAGVGTSGRREQGNG